MPGTAATTPLEDLSLVARLSVKMDLNLTGRRTAESPCRAAGTSRRTRSSRRPSARALGEPPAMLSPWERLEAGQFVDDDEDEKSINLGRRSSRRRAEGRAIDDIEVPIKEERTRCLHMMPTWADAALGLDDDEDEAPSPPSEEEAPAPGVGRRAAAD